MPNAQSDDWKPTWEDPPARHAEKMLWEKRLTALVKRPGQWCLLADYPDEEKARAHQLRSALHRRRYAVPRSDEDWEFTTRNGKVYGRYVGDAEA